MQNSVKMAYEILEKDMEKGLVIQEAIVNCLNATKLKSRFTVGQLIAGMAMAADNLVEHIAPKAAIKGEPIKKAADEVREVLVAALLILAEDYEKQGQEG